ncbi:MAG: SDR family oxidoreductase, partial [Chloroflexota bacterium]
VNAICPGYVNTPMTKATIENIAKNTKLTTDEALAHIKNQNPQQRLIESDEIAALALMLAGEEARGITGQAINVDGGQVMW